MEQVRVGVGVFVRHNGKFLVLHRVKEHGNGTWGLPGGHLEMGESFEACALREVLEETGIHATNPRVMCVTNDIFSETKHYITVFVETGAPSADFTLTEPEKYTDYRWVTEAEMPQPMFLSMVNFFQQKAESQAHAA